MPCGRCLMSCQLRMYVSRYYGRLVNGGSAKITRSPDTSSTSSWHLTKNSERKEQKINSYVDFGTNLYRTKGEPWWVQGRVNEEASSHFWDLSCNFDFPFFYGKKSTNHTKFYRGIHFLFFSFQIFVGGQQKSSTKIWAEFIFWPAAGCDPAIIDNSEN